jgi:hypothetical protein
MGQLTQNIGDIDEVQDFTEMLTKYYTETEQEPLSEDPELSKEEPETTTDEV